MFSYCNRQADLICLVTPSHVHAGIFGFAEFVQALALLVVVYTVAGTRYRFRIQIAPLSLFPVTFAVLVIIGIGSLGVDLWFSLRFPILRLLSNQAIWQAFFGLLFLSTALTWIWYAFIHPCVFGTHNCRRYAQTLFSYVLRGSASELPIIAAELARSADALVVGASTPRGLRHNQGGISIEIDPGEYARQILLLIANRKLCRSIVAEAPGTAIALFDATSQRRAYNIPLGQFASNITTEAVQNKDSILYHEDAGFFSGLIGYVKPFSRALYGDFTLVEALANQNRSPLEVDYQVRWLWDSMQVEAYGRAILVTLADYVEGGHWGLHSTAIFRALHDIRDATRDLYKLNGDQTAIYESDSRRRLAAIMHFISEATDILDKHKPPLITALRVRNSASSHVGDLYDLLADLLYDVILDASAVTSPADSCWGIHHNTVWDTVFGFHRGKAHKVIQFKLRRKLYDSARDMATFPNFEAARILGFCLNVTGLVIGKPDALSRSEFALRKVIIGLAKKHYLSVRSRLPDVAEACLIGSISFDESGNRLIKSYLKGLSATVPTDQLELDPPV